MAELKEANARLHMELDTAQSRLVEAERHEQALSSDYEGLKDFGDLRSSHAVVAKEKADLERTESEKRNGSKAHRIKNWPSFGMIQRHRWLRSGDDVWISPPTPLSLTFWSGFR
jgi:hypothetical protein